MKIIKFQRHPTDPECVILHVQGQNLPADSTRMARSAAFRAALESAGKLED